MERNKHKINLIIIFLLFITCSFIKGNDNRDMIQGAWRGSLEKVEIDLSFYEGKGRLLIVPSNKAYFFNYSFKNEKVLILSNDRVTSLHMIKQLSKDKLWLVPAKLNDSTGKSVDMVDHVEFKRMVEFSSQISSNSR